MPLALLLAAALAAPVPVNHAAEKRRLEMFWNDLDSRDPVTKTRAMFALLDEPRVVAFLREKLPPVEASKERVTDWLKDLDSDHAKVWQAAYEQLQYFHPQLALAPSEQLELVTTDNGKRLLFGLWRERLPTFDEETTYRARLTLDLAKPDHPYAEITFDLLRAGKASSTREAGFVHSLGMANSPAWSRAMNAAGLLRYIDTKESRAVCQRLASGHKDAKPTRYAAGALTPIDIPPAVTFTTTWEELIHGNFNRVFDLVHTPDAANRLKRKLPAIKASKEQISEWLKALDNEDREVWRPAYRKLLYFRPAIALDWREQIDAVTTAHGRTALFALWGRSPKTHRSSWRSIPTARSPSKKRTATANSG